MSIFSPHPDVTIPSASVFDFLFGSIPEDDLDRPALIDGHSGTILDYRSLIRDIGGVAGALAVRGIGVGDLVAILSPNTPSFAVVFHGVLRAGATATPINALYTADEIAKQLEDSGAIALFTVSALLPQAEEAASRVGIPDSRVFVVDGAAGHEGLKELLAERHTAPTVSFDPSLHLAVVPYSSGTTGQPKGVMLTHSNLVANVCQTAPHMGIAAEDRVVAVLPFFHIYGLTVLLNLALHQRAELITLPRFDLANFLDTIASYKATNLFIAPPVAVALAKHPLIGQYDLTSVRTVMSGAAPLDGELGHAVAERLSCTVLQGYGMSELSPVSHMARHDGTTPMSSVGLTVPNMECKLIDPANGEEVEYPEDEGLSAAGELWCKGPNVMLGYLNNPSATADTIDQDGFLHTGDLAVIDAHGNITIVDRLKELIKYKGYQVPPAELEALLLTHPQIADAAVIGVVNAEGEEVPKAFVVPQPNTDLTADAVVDFVAGKVAPHKKVRIVQFIDVVPKSAAGKILRKDLRGR